MGCGCGTNGNSRINHCQENPCRVEQSNTPACESLPSQIENFSKQFFGTIVKTEIDGSIVWTLPCNLDVGLPNNPRESGEGLACYFLRLFLEGIVGLTGPKGNPGDPGANGRNAYTVTVQSFSQPSPGSPIIQVLTSYNPAILVGLNVSIDTSGTYLVSNNDPSGALTLTLLEAFPGAPATIPAGKLVVISGLQGNQGIPGNTVVGPKGDKGDPGETLTATNGFYYAPIGTDYNLQVVYAAVNFVNSSPQVLLPQVGTYKITAVIDIRGLAGVALTDVASFKLRDTTISGDLPGSEHTVSNLSVDEYGNVVIDVHYDALNINTTVALFGKATTADRVSAVALRTTLTFVRLA